MSNYTKYRKYIAGLQKKLQFETFWKGMKARILDYIIKHNDESLWQIKRDISEIFGPQYARFTEQVFNDYDDIIDNVNKIYSDLGVDVDRNMERIIAIEEVTKTRLGKYEDDEVSKISRYIRKAIIDNKPVRELKRDLDRIGGRVSSYSNTIARSQIAGYGRESKNTKAIIGGVEYAEYVGVITEPHGNSKGTRAFCRERLNGTSAHGDNYYSIDEINQLSNGPKQLKPVITYCGGWNCNHDWEWDPFYKPSKKK